MLHTVSLKENAVFRRLYYRGASSAGRCLVLYCRPNGRKVNRLGLTVSAKLGHAVLRNRLRRRLREIYRLNESKLRTGFDIVIVARSAAVDADFSDLLQGFFTLAVKLGLTEQSK